MLGIKRIINFAVVIILTTLFGVALTLLLIITASVEILDEPANISEITSSKEYYESFTENFDSLVEKGKPLLGELDDKISEIDITEQIDSKTLDEFYNSSSNELSLWASGELDGIEISINPDSIEENVEKLDKSLGEKLGFIGKLIDVEDLLTGGKGFDSIKGEVLSLGEYENIRQGVENLQRKLLIITLILGVVLFLSLRSPRLGFFLVGAGLLIPFALLYGIPKYYSYTEFLNLLNIDSDIVNLFSTGNDTNMFGLIITAIYRQAEAAALNYAKITAIIGAVLMVVSQLAIKETTVDISSEE